MEEDKASDFHYKYEDNSSTIEKNNLKIEEIAAKSILTLVANLDAYIVMPVSWADLSEKKMIVKVIL